MKPKFTKVLMLLIFSIIAFSCITESTNKESVNEDLSCYPNSNRPSQVITYEEMADMMQTFDKGPKKELNKYLKKVTAGKDSVSTVYNWYKLEDLKQYIAYIERISKEKDIPVTGFRIYPSTYPENYSNKKLRNLQTLIFTPTTKLGDKDDVAFEPLYSEKGKPAEINQFLDQVRNKKLNKGSELKANSQNSLMSSSANRMRPTPPPY
jgi:hypothetical protein